LISNRNLILYPDIIIEIKRLDDANFLVAYATDKKIYGKSVPDYLKALDRAVPEVQKWLTEKAKEAVKI